MEGEGDHKIVVVRENDVLLAVTHGLIAERLGYQGELVTDPMIEFTSLQQRPDLVITFWGTRWDCTPDWYAFYSLAFVSACIEEGIPFIVITRETCVVPEEISKQAKAVLKKPYELPELQSAIREALV